MSDIGLWMVNFQSAKQYRQFRDQLDPLKGSMQTGLDWQLSQQTEAACEENEVAGLISNLGNNNFSNVWQLRQYLNSNASDHCKARVLLSVIKLLDDPSQQKKADAAAVLCAVWSGDFALLLDDEYIPQLIRALDGNNIEIKRDIVRALSSAALAAKDSHNQRIIVRALFREFKLYPQLKLDVKTAIERLQGIKLPLPMRIEMHNLCLYSPY